MREADGTLEPISRETFAELVRMYHHRVLKKALSLSNDPHAAADIVQETWLRAWTNRHALRDITAFGRWVEVICQREAWALLRRSRPQEPLDEEGPAARDWHSAPSEDDEVAGLYAGMGRLSPHDVEILSLKYFAGYSMRQIAVWLDIPEKRVKSRLYEARQRLFRAIGTAGDPRSLRVQFSHRREQVMDKIRLLELGASCLVRMSLKGQEAMLRTARDNQPFSEEVLSELRGIDQGAEFLLLCDGKLDISEFMWILAGCDPWLADRLLSSQQDDRSRLLGSAPGGYTVLETAPVMTVPDLEATVAWFVQTLGWNGGIDAWDEQGRGTYGSVLLGVGEAVHQRVRPFNGIHLSRGRPPSEGCMLAMLYVEGLDRLHERVKASGWGRITDIVATPWASGVCDLTTLDGYLLRIFETAKA